MTGDIITPSPIHESLFPDVVQRLPLLTQAEFGVGRRTCLHRSVMLTKKGSGWVGVFPRALGNVQCASDVVTGFAVLQQPGR